MDNKRKELHKKILALNLHFDMKLLFLSLIENIDISDKKIDTFLKMTNPKIVMGFLYKLVIHSAYKYGVPNVYIKLCIDNKKLYINSKNNKYLYNQKESQLYKNRMHTDYRNLIKATLQLSKEKNSRKGKITQILEKISDKNI
jgi:hypothetical protein